MTKERLSDLSLASLLDVAAKAGITAPEGIDRETLIELIQEAQDEDRDEREQSNNSAMRIKEKKYEIIQDEEVEPQEKADYPLPDRYNETRIVALLRDPLWAFAYWEIKDSDLQPFEQSADFRELFLRVHEMGAAASNDAGDPAGYFDIPIKVTDGSWYINLPNPGKSYAIELYAAVGSVEHLLCRSNTITSPIGETALDQIRGMISEESDVLALSGLSDYGTSSIRDQIPQRIMSILDDDYLETKS